MELLFEFRCCCYSLAELGRKRIRAEFGGCGRTVCDVRSLLICSEYRRRKKSWRLYCRWTCDFRILETWGDRAGNSDRFDRPINVLGGPNSAAAE